MQPDKMIKKSIYIITENQRQKKQIISWILYLSDIIETVAYTRPLLT